MVLYNLFIEPLIYFFELLILTFSRFLSNPIFLLFAVSFVVNFLSYPVFKKVEDLCKKDSDDYQKLLPKINSIKANFSGRERRMLLAVYFRQNGYHPLLAHFKQSLTVLLYVPLFMASYIVISKSPFLDSYFLNKLNEAFLPIRILPIVMTLINVFSVSVYMKNKSYSSRLYAYVLSAVFLFLLYYSPASIVLYWIFNNSFSLLRNIYFYKKEKFLLCSYGYAFSVVLIAFINRFNLASFFDLLFIGLLFFAKVVFSKANKDLLYIYIIFLFSIIFFIMCDLKIVNSYDSALPFVATLFFIEVFFLYHRFFIKKVEFSCSLKRYFIVLSAFFILFGCYFPLSIIASDPSIFYMYIDLKDLVLSTIETGIGLFLIYPLMLFCLGKKYRKEIYWLTVVLFLVLLTEQYITKLPMDEIDGYMSFWTMAFYIPVFSYIFEICLILLLMSGTYFVFKHKKLNYLDLFFIALFFVGGAFSFSSGKTIYEDDSYFEKETGKSVGEITSKGKNVLILFMDRAISAFFPKAMKEKPELKKVYTGFVYYPYTVSFAPSTLHSSPSLLGGYEYTPLKLQNEKTRKMVDKHNEAISVLPEMFRKNGYKVLLHDIPYINYNDRRKKRFFHKDISLAYSQNTQKYRTEKSAEDVKKNMFYFVLFKSAGQAYKNLIYNSGKYTSFSKRSNASKDVAMFHDNILKNFVNTLKIKETKTNSFITFVSLLPHSPAYLSEDYDFTDEEEGYINENEHLHYNVNMLSYLEIEKLLQKLKKNKAYDNTRIIIVSDHGMFLDVDGVDKAVVKNNALLLFKDFNAKGTYKTSSEFMTTADVVWLATHGLIKPLNNPLTGRKISPQQEKKNGVDIIVNGTKKWDPRHYSNKDRTYFYEDDVTYEHIDKNKIKKMIEIKTGKQK